VGLNLSADASDSRYHLISLSHTSASARMQINSSSRPLSRVVPLERAEWKSVFHFRGSRKKPRSLRSPDVSGLNGRFYNLIRALARPFIRTEYAARARTNQVKVGPIVEKLFDERNEISFKASE